MLSSIAIGAVVILAAIFAIAATRPDTFRVQRSKTVHASPETIYAQLIDLRKWTAWSPYDKLDPDMKRTYSGAAGGEGAVCEWSGNSKAGAGRMEIVDVRPPYRVTIQLDFVRPFEGHNIAEFTLDPVSDATLVTWSMHGPQRYIGKVMSLFLNMDKLIGREFETGLANLNAIVSSGQPGIIVK